MSPFRSFFAAVLLTLAFFPAEAANRDWVQTIAVLPPSAGWESEQGRSADLALRLAENEVNDSAEGAGGRDVRFVRIEATSRADDLRKLEVRAVLAAGPDLPETFVRNLANGWTGPPIVVAGGERIEFSPGNAPYLYALDLFQDFRADALSRFAAAHLPAKSRIALVSDNLGEDSRRGASLTRVFLEEKGFDVFPLFFPGEGENAFEFVMQEIRDSGSKAVIVWLGAMSAMDMWRVAAKFGISVEIWNAGDRDEMLVPFQGLLAVSQNATDGFPFLGLSRRLRLEFSVRPEDLLSAARVYACARWIIAALSRVNASGASLDVALSTMSGIPFGKEMLSINPITHRPQSRSVRIYRVSSHRWRQEAEFDVAARGAAY